MSRNMKGILALCFVLAVLGGGCQGSRTKRQSLPREFENIDIDNYLKNERAVKLQLKCILEDGPCDQVGKYLKKTIPDVLANQCETCDKAQKERATKILSHIQKKFPEDWEKSVKKFSGGLVKPEDAERLEKNLGIKMERKFIGNGGPPPTTTTTTESDWESAGGDGGYTSSTFTSHSSTTLVPVLTPESGGSGSSSDHNTAATLLLAIVAVHGLIKMYV